MAETDLPVTIMVSVNTDSYLVTALIIFIAVAIRAFILDWFR